jgi:hypothetical protein
MADFEVPSTLRDILQVRFAIKMAFAENGRRVLDLRGLERDSALIEIQIKTLHPARESLPPPKNSLLGL